MFQDDLKANKSKTFMIVKKETKTGKFEIVSREDENYEFIHLVLKSDIKMPKLNSLSSVYIYDDQGHKKLYRPILQQKSRKKIEIIVNKNSEDYLDKYICKQDEKEKLTVEYFIKEVVTDCSNFKTVLCVSEKDGITSSMQIAFQM
ncbi:hypothetical protein A0H76_1878 [Hepatospora eriocheir]|uniref:Uncharacterized protein n=1 Tax=Hepatospora eriocheir TaxID=1081669 RepID=A0A1X0QKJ2_9MICR|nr:hypothetical protein A0H76_1878 [Hepatospora eriocheir]